MHNMTNSWVGIVSLLFCGITLKHYAYYNMSRRTQLTTKYLFQVLAQLSENFIFIYLGLTLFTGENLVWKPLFILITVVGICAARWAAVFPLSKAINWFIRFRAKRRGQEVADELPHSYQMMLFWAGLRGAVGVALAAGLKGPNGKALQATVLVVVVLTVIIFGGTTARMLEIMEIRTGVVEEIDSDDEFDIESATNGTYYKRTGNALGHMPKSSVSLGKIEVHQDGNDRAPYSSGSSSASPPVRPTSATLGRKNSSISQKERDTAQRNLLGRGDSSPSEEENNYSDSDLPPAAKPPKRKTSRPPRESRGASSPSIYMPPSHLEGAKPVHEPLSASGALSQLFRGTTEENAAWFRHLDEDFIKPKLLLDQNSKGGGYG